MKLTKSLVFWKVYSVLLKGAIKYLLNALQDNTRYHYLKLFGIVVINQLFLILVICGFLQYHKVYQHLILLGKLYYIFAT